MSLSNNVSRNNSESYGITQGQSIGRSESISETQGIQPGTGRELGTESLCWTVYGVWKRNFKQFRWINWQDDGYDFRNVWHYGFSPSIGYSRSYQWLDQGVKDILELLEFQNERIKSALRGQGAFLYLCVFGDRRWKMRWSLFSALAKSTWQNENCYGFTITDNEPRPWRTDALALSFFLLSRLMHHVVRYMVLRNTNILLYCCPQNMLHTPHFTTCKRGRYFFLQRFQIFRKFSVPQHDAWGKSFLGNVLSAERYTLEQGVQNPRMNTGCRKANWCTGYVCGASRSGKTVAAMRFSCGISSCAT